MNLYIYPFVAVQLSWVALLAYVMLTGDLGPFDGKLFALLGITGAAMGVALMLWLLGVLTVSALRDYFERRRERRS